MGLIDGMTWEKEYGLSTRQKALFWWNGLTLYERVIKMNEFGIEQYRSSTSLSGSEIEKIYDSENII